MSLQMSSVVSHANPEDKPESEPPAKKQKLLPPKQSPPCKIVEKAQKISGDALAAYMAKHWPDEWF